MEIANPKKSELPQFSGRALVVDDNSVNLIVASNVLKKYGLTVDKASSGEEALDILSNVRYDILFLDLRMPGMSGQEVLEKIRTSPREYGGGIPVIALTAAEEGELTDGLTALGFAAYLGKPIDRNALEELLECFLKSGKDPEEPERENEQKALSPILSAFQAALAEKRYRVSEGLLKQLLECPAGEQQKEVRNRLKAAWDAFDYKEAMKLCEELAEQAE